MYTEKQKLQRKQSPLYKFLKSKRLVTKFENNVKQYDYTHKVEHVMLDIYILSPYHYSKIAKYFTWLTTLEGDVFWANIDDEWRKYVDNNNNNDG